VYDRKSAAALAERVRSLVGTERTDWDLAAARLGVAGGDLREVVEYQTRYPAPRVLSAIVAFFGVDASWLVTGRYDPTMHRRVEEEGIPAREVIDRLLREPGPQAP
jgi:hypothetical protein